MSDNAVKHVVAMFATVICALAYLAGYFSGQLDWWWTVFSVMIVYGGIYRLISK